MKSMAFEISDLVKGYSTGFRLEVESVCFEDEKIYAIRGPNGAGKTTLLRILAGLEKQDRGQVLFKGARMSVNGAGLALRRRIVFLSQKPVLFRGTVIKNVLYGMKIRKVPRREARDRADAALAEVGLRDFADRPAEQLSGGEAQRVALARAFCVQPEGLLLDEPTSHLDSTSLDLIERILLKHNRTHGTLILFSTHDSEQAARLTESVIHLENGRIVTGAST